SDELSVCFRPIPRSTCCTAVRLLTALQFDRGANGAAMWTNDRFNVMRSILAAPLSDRFPPFTLT
ncbi:MAG: hypothetical protein L0G27_12140, partial [Paracoccus sp. (in: a-proteobacteria)]|nr:hypothetical protein [Paracoccus sp. (in: a-proteobacteria)]